MKQIIHIIIAIYALTAGAMAQKTGSITGIVLSKTSQLPVTTGSF
jgi:hypothetical protein